MKKLLKSLIFTTVLFSILAFTPPTANYDADSYTKLLIHGDQADGTAGTDILDSETTAKTITAVGNAQVDTAQYKNLTGSTGSILFDGTGDWLTLADSADWADGTGNWTDDWWVRFNSVSTARGFFEQATDANNYVSFFWYPDNKLYFWVSTGGSFVVYASVSWTPSTNTWYHMAIERYGTGENNLYIFIDGVSQTLTWTNAMTANYSFPDFTGLLYIGATPNTYNPMNGWIDEFRTSKGIARDWASATRRIMIISKKFWKNLMWDIKEIICDYSSALS